MDPFSSDPFGDEASALGFPRILKKYIYTYACVRVCVCVFACLSSGLWADDSVAVKFQFQDGDVHLYDGQDWEDPLD